MEGKQEPNSKGDISIIQIVPTPTNIRLSKNATLVVSVTTRVGASSTKICFRILDLIVSITILPTITVGFWRGVWQIADHYCEVYQIDPWFGFGTCSLILVGLYYFQETLRKYVEYPNKMNFIVFYIMTRFILILHALSLVNQWRGLWIGVDNLFNHYSLAPFFKVIIPISIAIPLKTFTNYLVTPLSVRMDHARNIHECPLRFSTPPQEYCQYFLDCLFSVVVVQSLIIISWSGLWQLADKYIYPQDLLSSGVTCWIIGNSIAIILCIIQPVYYKQLNRMDETWRRLALMNLVTLIGFVSCVFCWLGCWELYNNLLIFQTHLTSEWVSAITGCLVATLMGCLSTLAHRGASTDGKLSNYSHWSISYFSLWLQQSENHS